MINRTAQGELLERYFMLLGYSIVPLPHPLISTYIRSEKLPDSLSTLAKFDKEAGTRDYIEGMLIQLLNGDAYA